MSDDATPDEADLPDMAGGLEPADLGGLDFGGLLGQAQEMMQASATAAEEVVEGSAGGGMVKVAVNGRYEFKSVTIDPKVVDPGDVTMLEDLVLAALRDASSQIAAEQAGALGGLDLGSLGGLFGGE